VHDHSAEIVAAIYDLRDAVEEKIYAELASRCEDGAEARHALLDAVIRVESSTQFLIELSRRAERLTKRDRRERMAYATNKVVDIGSRSASNPGQA